MYPFSKKKKPSGQNKTTFRLGKVVKYINKKQDNVQVPPAKDVEEMDAMGDDKYPGNDDDDASEVNTGLQEMDFPESQDDVSTQEYSNDEANDDEAGAEDVNTRKRHNQYDDDDNSNKKFAYTFDDDRSRMELDNHFEKMALQIIEEEPSPPSEKFDRYAFHQYINKNLYNDEFKSRNQLLNAFHIWKNRYDIEYINETMERLMLGRLGYCYVLKNNVLYCRVHSMLKFRDYIIPFAYIRKSDNRIVYKNYAMFRDLLNYIYYEYDNAREHKLENHNVIGLIHTLLYPRHCHLYVRLGWLTKLVYHYIKSPEDHDDSLFEITVKNDPIYVFEKMRSVEAQQIVIDKLRGHFKWMYPPFNKSDESIRKFIYYYYTEMCGKATVKAPFLYKRF